MPNFSWDTIEKYKELNIKEYQCSCTLDSKTCKVCALLDGKRLKVDKAIVGVNCPPLHDGCRCHVRPELGYKRIGTRAMQNPLTKKSGKTADHNYTKWEESLTSEERDALIKQRGW